MFRPGAPKQAQFSVGGANGALELQDVLSEGANAGTDAARACGFDAVTQVPETAAVASEPILPLWRVPSQHAPGRGPKAVFVSWQDCR